ncbi:MAG: glycosyltransferase family 4 protein [Nitrospirae bacterium]|nr:glycosyltransferase family 4 protein [Nitrospirota bacterium]
MKTRVVHIITKLELGGAQEATLHTVKRLDRGRYDVTLVTGEPGILTPEARAMEDVEFIEVPELVREISPVKDTVALLKLYGVIRRLRRDSPGGVLVHTHSSKAGILGRAAAWLAGADRVVHSIHGYGFNDFQGPLKRRMLITAEKVVARMTDGFTADSQSNIDRGRPLGFFDRAEAEVVYCAIPVAYFSEPPKADVRAGLGIPKDAPVALMVACLKPQKAPSDFVRVAAEVLKCVPEARFLIAGDGELRGLVEAEAARLGVSDRVTLLGWRRDVRDLLHSCDVFLLTSLWEGLPKVLAQAMSAGKPIVATAVDGTPEAVKDGVNGYLAMPHDIALMAEKVRMLLTDKALAARMGDAGREKADEFDESEMMRRVEALYARLLTAK